MYVCVCYGGVWVCVHTSGHDGTYMHVCTGTVCASMLFMGVHVYHACVPCMGQVYVHLSMCIVHSKMLCSYNNCHCYMGCSCNVMRCSPVLGIHLYYYQHDYVWQTTCDIDIVYFAITEEAGG